MWMDEWRGEPSDPPSAARWRAGLLVYWFTGLLGTSRMVDVLQTRGASRATASLLVLLLLC